MHRLPESSVIYIRCLYIILVFVVNTLYTLLDLRAVLYTRVPLLMNPGYMLEMTWSHSAEKYMTFINRVYSIV